MRQFAIRVAAFMIPLAFASFAPRPALAEGDLHKVKHIIVIMQENHSFDNYFGALAYAPGSPTTRRAATSASVTAAAAAKATIPALTDSRAAWMLPATLPA